MAGWTGSRVHWGSDLNRQDWSWCKTSESVQPQLSVCFCFKQLQPHTLTVVFYCNWNQTLAIGDICESVFVGKTKYASNSRHIPDPNKFFRNAWKMTRMSDSNSLLYSRWKPAATTLMSLWKCSRSWFEVELRRAGAVVPAKDGDNQATEPGSPTAQTLWNQVKILIQFYLKQHGAASEDLRVQKRGKGFFFFAASKSSLNSESRRKSCISKR